MKNTQLKILVILFIVVAPVAAHATMQVVATIPDIGSVARWVGGDAVKVTVLCPGATDPHFLPAKPSLARAMSKADVLLYNGLEIEVGWLPQLINKARNPDIRPGEPGDIDCSRAVGTLLEVPDGPIDRGEGDVHPYGNPHYTLDPRRMALVAKMLGERFGALDPEHAAGYSQRADSYVAATEAKLEAWREETAALREIPIVIHRRNWAYLIDFLGLNVVGEIENRPGIAPSPRHMQQLIEKSRELPELVIMASSWDDKASAEVAERTGGSLAVLPAQVEAEPDVAEYFQLMDIICERLAAAASQEGE